MATSTPVTVDEYLKTVYRPDCDYTDGAVEERNLGELDHAWVQGNIAAAFKSRFKQTGLTAIPEWRFQVSPAKFRVPDIIVTQGKPLEKILTRPPLLCVEILSPEDRAARVSKRIQEYLDFGVPAVWLIDPEARTIEIHRPKGMERVTGSSVTVEGTGVEIPLTEIFD